MAEIADLQLLQAKQVLGKLGDMADQQLPEFDGAGIDKLLNFLPAGTAPELPVCLRDIDPAPSCLPDYDGIDPSLIDVRIPEIDISQLEQYEMQLEARLVEVERQIRNDTASLAERLGGVDLQVLEDYEPPPLDLATSEQQEHAARTEEFEADTAVSLNSLDSLEVATDVDAPAGRGQPGAGVGVDADTDLSWFSFKNFASEDFPYEQARSSE